MTNIETMKLALDALEITTSNNHSFAEKVRLQADSITALRQAIEQAQKQEPVAWWVTGPDGEIDWTDEPIQHKEQRPLEELVDGCGYAPLYTSPPQRQPLTVEQLREHWQVAKVLDMTDAEIDFADYVLIARDVEALYGIKGEA